MKGSKDEDKVNVSRVIRSTSSIRKRTVYYRFYLLKPKFNINLHDISMKIIGFKEVAEVYLTEGASGILVKTKFFDDSKPSAIEQFLKSTIPSKYGILVSPIQYEKFESGKLGIKNRKPSRLKNKRIAHKEKVG